MTIQFAAEEDTGLILRFIKELADYEGMLSEVEATEELLQIGRASCRERVSSPV